MSLLIAAIFSNRGIELDTARCLDFMTAAAEIPASHE
jgi:hypothetical protein